MERRQSYGDGSPADELLQRLEDLKRSLQRFTGGKGLWVMLAFIPLLWLGSGLYVDSAEKPRCNFLFYVL